MRKTTQARLRGWLQLIRLPYLFTVPGDPITGFLLAGGQISDHFFSLLAVCWISFTAYLFGLITNDLADIQNDLKERPDRPLPSGIISTREAAYGAQLCFILAVVTSLFLGWKVFFITFVVLICIYTYNFYVKYRPASGSMLMAVCRALSFALGILIVNQTTFPYILGTVLFGTGIFLYYFGMTEISRYETLPKMVRPGGRQLLLGAASCAIVPLILTISLFRGSNTLLPILCGLLAIVLCAAYLLIALWVFQVSRTGASPARVQMAIGALIRSTLLIQAAAAASFGIFPLVLILLAFLAASIIAGRRSAGN